MKVKLPNGGIWQPNEAYGKVIGEGSFMKLLGRILCFSVTPTPIDLFLVRSAGWSVGIGVLVLVALTLPRHASSPTELFLGLGIAGLNCLVSVIFGALAVRIHFAGLAVKMSARSRIWEWTGYFAGVAILVFGAWFLTTLPLTRAGFIIAILLILALTLATISVGILLTLVRHNFARPPITSP
jgi:hypothetical protein